MIYDAAQQAVLLQGRSHQAAACLLPACAPGFGVACRRSPVPQPAGGHSAIAGLGSRHGRSEEHTSELQSLMRISYAVFCLKKKNKNTTQSNNKTNTNNKRSADPTKHTT